VLDLTSAMRSLSSPGTYMFVLTASKDVRTASAISYVTLVPSDSSPKPTVSIAPVMLPYLNPSLPLTLTAVATPAVASDAISLQWSISLASAASGTALGQGVLNDPCLVTRMSCTVASTSVFSPTFVLVPFALTEGGRTYTFRVTAEETGAINGSVWAEIELPQIPSTPHGGYLALVGGNSGTALVTPFNISAFGWTAGASSSSRRRQLSSAGGSEDVLDYPLSYRIAYLPASGPGTPTTLVPFQATAAPQFNASVYLPAGSWLLVVFVSSARGAISSLAAALATGQAVTVVQASTSQLAGAASNAAALATAHQTAQALQLASGIASSLSASPSTTSSSAIISSLITNVIIVTLSSAVGQQALNASASDSSAADTLSLAASTLTALTSSACDLSNASRTAALLAATTLANSVTAVSSATTSQSTLQSISNSAAACPSKGQVTAASCPGEQQQSSTQALAQSALNTLTSTVLSTLTVPGGAGIDLRSTLASVQVGLTYTNPSDAPAGSAASQLFGSGTSSFGPLPADALSNYSSGSTVAVVQLTSAFNSYCASLASNGTSRLEVLNPSNGAIVPVNNLSTPISIVLPPSAASPSSSQSQSHGVCAYWDPGVNLYATDGCQGLPSPLPPGVVPSLNASLFNLSLASTSVLCSSGAAVSQSAKLLRTLQFSGGSLMSGCTPTILDCPTLGSAGVVYLNPAAPAFAPAVRCPAAAPTPPSNNCSCLAAPSEIKALLVFTGATCKLWRSGNSLHCFWNATVQAFQGTGCISAPQIRPTLAQQSPSCLCSHLTDFSAFSAPSIPVASSAQMINISPGQALSKARTFLAIILALFCAMHVHVSYAVSLDRRRMANTRKAIFSDSFGFAEEDNVWTWRLYSTVDPLSGVHCGPAVRFAAAVGLPLARLHFAVPEELIDFDADAEHVDAATSTALVFALLRMRFLVDPEELVRRQAAAAELFHKQLEHSLLLGFEARVSAFSEMFAGQTLSRPSMWLAVARLWRIILLRRSGSAPMGGGGWAPTSGLSLALFCTRNETLESLEVQPGDFFGVEQVMTSVPQYLNELFRDRGDAAVRVWTTLLVCAVLSRISASSLAPESEFGDVSEEGHATLLDYADAWVGSMLSVSGAPQLPPGRHGASPRGSLRDIESPVRSEALLHIARGELLGTAHRDADELLRNWRRVHNSRVARLRALVTSSNSFHGVGGASFSANRLRRTMGNIFVALHRRHEAAGTLLAPLSDGLTRAHRAALLMTTLLGLLTVNTWFYEARSKSCCGQLRAQLACPPGLDAPCLGFIGDCKDLQAQFADFYVGGLQCPSGLDNLRIRDWQCTAFPSGSNRDNLFVALIASAVSLLPRLVLSVLLQISTETEHSFTLLFFHPVVHSIMRGRRRSWLSWRWREERPAWLTRLLLRFEPQPLKFAMEWLADRAVDWFPYLTRRDGDGSSHLPAGVLGERIKEERRSAARRSAAAGLGIALVYTTWAILVWFIVVYGIQIFSLQGSVSEYDFVRSWAITAGVEQATQARAIFTVLTSGLLLHFMDVFYLIPHLTWLEAWLDAKSVAATVTAGASIFRYLRAHVEHHAAVGYR